MISHLNFSCSSEDICFVVVAIFCSFVLNRVNAAVPEVLVEEIIVVTSVVGVGARVSE